LRLDKYLVTVKTSKSLVRLPLCFASEEKYCTVSVWASILACVAVLAVDFLSQYFYRNLSESGFCLISGGLGVLFGSGGMIGRRLLCFLLRFT
jgi:transposase